MKLAKLLRVHAQPIEAIDRRGERRTRTLVCIYIALLPHSLRPFRGVHAGTLSHKFESPVPNIARRAAPLVQIAYDKVIAPLPHARSPPERNIFYFLYGFAAREREREIVFPRCRVYVCVFRDQWTYSLSGKCGLALGKLFYGSPDAIVKHLLDIKSIYP